MIPSAKNRRVADIYHWGKKFPPPKGVGNYYGEECKRNPVPDTSRKPIEGYDDGFDRTAPVGRFEASEFGRYDMGGNSWEWCEDWYSTLGEKRVLRGGSWHNLNRDNLLSSDRYSDTPTTHYNTYGFRGVNSQ